MSIKITKSAEETYRRSLHTLHFETDCGLKGIVVIDDDDNGGSISVYDENSNALEVNEALENEIRDCFSENANPSELTEGVVFVKTKFGYVNEDDVDEDEDEDDEDDSDSDSDEDEDDS